MERQAGLGGVLRDEEGELIMAFSILIECSSHNETEAKATWYGLLTDGKASSFKLNKVIEDTSALCLDKPQSGSLIATEKPINL
ncbi:hypothetical protein KY290_034112 [Solanum tuberosum]|uniref:RNase H type-1 domain-containing protein n=1 Tax=Solanum tuberosum TaxID=4113 RepID=A0ABQ7U2B1_SOLTU|nr:hypothetical protein KY289_033504 [Solanum tuberosum]KAH0741069.1 hypothetical protein KY290_034112 [Solanum tuberosum]